MSTNRVLRGGCQCGRNMYIVQPPSDAAEVAQVLFDPAPLHRLSLASPLPTYLRVPLAWYHSTVLPFFPDETHSMIHRSYEHPGQTSSGTRRHFCGFCGTPLSFWSETPASEANYIRLALGSLSTEDLDELDEWARAGDTSDNDDDDNDDDDNDEEEEEEEKDDDNEAMQEEVPRESLKRSKPEGTALGRVTSLTGLPWFDSFVEGSRLGRHLLRQQKQQQQLQRQSQSTGRAHIRRHDAGSAQSADGAVQVEWEVLEWTEGDDDDGDGGQGKSAPRSSEASPAKRARFGEGDD
ncbi:uncharacterized protein SPSK_07792 [Sporothrix schenckii 1099-18]|uniref:CENP-V/GFA domain-containing protein n=2 Tax=Sporothrix schenckii TaxID=29908 RepID=U7Q0V2_SPOS1|nr:uncharacterized protein SPSK_07792 [Sporothrix schenckii 1099-18]ERT01463.1 hypothetical protein HMPREF1624_02712 [Sporothrix schenckii ATCC 58251]KJR88657.1 hypothetical protein SPSK_07792 [Sporothrix schenckii 1099-18]